MECFIEYSIRQSCVLRITFLCSNSDGPVVIYVVTSPSINITLTVVSFNTNFESAGVSGNLEVDTTTVMGRLIYENSSHYVSTLKFSSARNFDLTFNLEMLSYRYSNSKQIEGKRSLNTH